MGIKVIFLCAGYGTRLKRDIQNDESKEYIKLLEVPKALLPIGTMPLLSHWIQNLAELNYVDHCYVVTNNCFYSQFETWSQKHSKMVSVVNDGTENNEGRMGAVASIQFAIDQFSLKDEDVLIIGGDTLFYNDFAIKDFFQQFYENKKIESNCGLVTVYRCGDSETVKCGILEIDEASGRVLHLLEKPKQDETKSRLACPCFYLLSSGSTELITRFLKERKDSPLEEKDATGHFIKYLISHSHVYSYKISGRFDVGGLQSYRDCHAYFS